MALYAIDVYDDAATLAVAQAASPKVTGIKHSIDRIYVETREDLTAEEETAVRTAVIGSICQVRKENGGGQPA